MSTQGMIGLAFPRQGGMPAILRPAGRISQLPWFMGAGAVALAAGAAVSWVFSGYPQPLDLFLRSLGGLFLTGFALVECALSLACWRLFDRDEPLRRAWLLLALAAACRAMGLVASTLVTGLTADPGPAATDWGQSSGAPLTLALAAVGLLLVLRACHSLGRLSRPSVPESIFLSLVGALMWGRFIAVTRAARPVEALGGVSYLLVGLLLLEAVLLRRSVQDMGEGLVGRCWGAYVAAIFLTAAGAMGGWALISGYLPWHYRALNSIVLLWAALAFALAPAHQVEAILRARRR